MKFSRRRKPATRHPSRASIDQVDLAAERVCETGAQLVAALNRWQERHLVESEA